MSAPFVIEMMSGEALLWRCLHGGPLTAASVDSPGPDGHVPFVSFRARNLSFLDDLVKTYGACAVVAKQGEAVVGHLRFYPKTVRELAAPGLGLCLQQEFPNGPADDLARRRLTPLNEIVDKTLLVHCMMVAPDGPGGGSLRRQGIGRRMARALVDWAGANGWQAIEATAYASVPIVYTISGQAGRSFWEGLGFRFVRTGREPLLETENEFVRTMREQAAALGIDPASITDKYTMRREL
jgi:hypothetical protein